GKTPHHHGLPRVQIIAVILTRAPKPVKAHRRRGCDSVPARTWIFRAATVRERWVHRSLTVAARDSPRGAAQLRNRTSQAKPPCAALPPATRGRVAYGRGAATD